MNGKEERGRRDGEEEGRKGKEGRGRLMEKMEYI